MSVERNVLFIVYELENNNSFPLTSEMSDRGRYFDYGHEQIDVQVLQL